MPLSIKIKITLIWCLTTLGIFIAPATAEAPHFEDINPERLVIIKELQIKDKAYEDPKAYALTLFDKYGWKDNQMTCLDQLWTKESNWRSNALNKSSGAFGIAQFLPTTWANYKYPYKPKDPQIQIDAGLRYIYKRYSSPCHGWAFWQKKAGPDLIGGWY